jgi:hypothetical protein
VLVGWDDYEADGRLYVLVACIGEDDDWEAAEGFYGSGPGYVADWTSLTQCISGNEMGEHDDDQIGN